MTTHTTDLVSDWGGLGNGVFDNCPKWQDWLDAVAGYPAGDDAVLRIPAGTYIFYTDPYHLLAGIPHRSVVIQGYGGTVTIDTAGNGMSFGMGFPHNYGVPPAGSSRLQTCSAGAMSVICTTPGGAALLATDLTASYQPWCYVGGIDTQGGGTSTNAGFFEYKRISAVNTGTGEITFTAPLKYSYKSTWPVYSPGDVGEVDNGGPATIWYLKPEWDIEVDYQNITLPTINLGGAVNVFARKVKFTNCTVTNHAAFNPSIQYLFWVDGGDWSGVDIVEHDKMVNTVVFSGGVLGVPQWQVPNSCTERIIVDNANLPFLDGTTTEFVLTSAGTIGTLNLGAGSYGCSNWAKIAGTVTTIAHNATTLKGGPVTELGCNVEFGLSAGVITLPKSLSGVERAFVPGYTCFWVDSSGTRKRRSFRVVDLTDDASNTYVTIDPPIANWAVLTANFGPLIWIQTHACPQLYVYQTSNWAGYYGQAGAFGQPIDSYWINNYGTQASGSIEAIGWDGGGGTSTPNYIGTLTAATITVNPALSSPSANFVWPGVFSNYPITKSDYSVVSYGKTTSLNSTSTTTISGLSLPDADSWFSGGGSLGATADLSAVSSPMNVQIELTFDQGVVPQAVPITAFECEQLAEVFAAIPELYIYYSECSIATSQTLMGQACL